MDRIYLITGAAGHLGGTILRSLIEKKKSVRVFVLPGEKNLPEGNFEIYTGDICDKSTMHAFFGNTGTSEVIVIHCAAIVSIASKCFPRLYDVNVNGTKNIVDLCVENKVEKLIYVSSVHAITEKPKGETVVEVADFDPDVITGPYAKTKAEATKYVAQAMNKGLKASIIHPSGFVGPLDCGGGHFTTLIKDYCTGKLGASVEGGYDFVDVRDVAEGIISCVERGRDGECYILSGKYFSMREMLFMLHEITGKKEVKTILPLWFVRFIAPIAEMYYGIAKKKPLFTAYSVYTLNTNAVFSHEKATGELGYVVRDMRQTLKDTIKWLGV